MQLNGNSSHGACILLWGVHLLTEMLQVKVFILIGYSFVCRFNMVVSLFYTKTSGTAA